MASMDHTARCCPSVRTELKSKSTSTVSVPLSAVSEERERRRVFESRRAGAALAIAVMEGMLKRHRTLMPTRTISKRTSLLLLNPVQCIGLETAIDLLHHYADMLPSGSSG